MNEWNLLLYGDVPCAKRAAKKKGGIQIQTPAGIYAKAVGKWGIDSLY
jgi:hypothetical protein